MFPLNVTRDQNSITEQSLRFGEASLILAYVELKSPLLMPSPDVRALEYLKTAAVSSLLSLFPVKLCCFL